MSTGYRRPSPPPALRGAFLLTAVAAVSLALPAGADAPPPSPPPAVPGATLNPIAIPSAMPPANGPTPLPSGAVLQLGPPSPAPSSSPTAPPRRGRRSRPTPAATGAGPTPSPTSPGYASLDGVWEVQLQHPDTTDYSHFYLKQTAQDISGTWKVGNQTYKVLGTYDGHLIRLEATAADGITASFSGYVESATDMVGIYNVAAIPGKTAGARVSFTAEHRVATDIQFGPPGANRGGGSAPSGGLPGSRP